MRILLWSELFWPYVGGAEVFLAQLASSLRKRDHDVLVVTSHDSLDLPDEVEHDGVPIRRLPFRKVIRQNDLEGIRELLGQTASCSQANDISFRSARTARCRQRDRL